MIKMTSTAKERMNKCHEKFQSKILTPQYLGVSENNGTPKSSILIGFSIINHPFWGTSIFGNPHLHLSQFLEGKKNKKTVLFENQVASGLTIMIVKTLPKSWVIPIMMPTITMTSATSIKALEKSRSHLFTKIYPCFFGGEGRKGHGKTSEFFQRTYVWWAIVDDSCFEQT